MKCFLISILYFTVFPYFLSICKALDVYQYIDAKAYSMGNTLSVLPGFANPASCSFTTVRSASLQYVNRYGVKELSTYAGLINLPNKYLNTGLYMSRFGFNAYHETMVSVNVYKKLSSYLGLGIRINYLNLHYSDKETNKSLVTGDIGVYIKPVKHLILSVLAVNPLRTGIKIGKNKYDTSIILSVGVSYEIAKYFLVTGELEKDFLYPAIVKLGMEYIPIKQLSIRAGMYAKPFTPSFGLGINISPFVIDLAFNRHPVLGFYSCCGLLFNF